MIYSEVVNRIVFGVVRRAPNAISLNHLRAAVDAAFPQISSDVAEVYAADENKRNELRVIKDLTFTSGSTDLPTGLLKKYLKDCTLIVAVEEGQPAQYYGYRPEYADFIRPNDTRLGIWSTNSNTIYANTPATAGSGPAGLSGAATFNCICSPDVPTTEDDEYVAPADFVPDFIDAFINWIIQGPTMAAAAKAT